MSAHRKALDRLVQDGGLPLIEIAVSVIVAVLIAALVVATVRG